MTIALLLLGLFFIIGGIITKNKKLLWLHQGLYKRPVNVEKYTKYMGILDVITGIIYIITGIIFYYLEISDGTVFLIFAIYCCFSIYGEVKYREKRVK